MCKLKRQIDQLEKKIAADHVLMRQNYSELKREMNTPAVLVLSLLSGFTAGYLLGHPSKAKDPNAKPAGHSLITEIHRQVNLLLPLLFL
jgi:hypothetical protein